MTRRELRWLLLAALPPALLFLFPLLTQTHFAGDVTYSFQPWLTYAAQEIQAGRFPLWNPYSASGEALTANPQLMLYYAPAAWFWMLPFTAAWRVLLAFHQLLLFFGAALLIRSFFRAGRLPLFLGALSLAWGGFAVVNWEFPAAAATLAQTPLFVTAAFGAPLLTAPAAALLLFAGYTQIAYYAVALGGGVFVWRAWREEKTPVRAFARAGRWLAALAGGCGLAAVLLLPPLETAAISLRGGVTGADAAAHALTPALLLKFIFPNIIDKIALAFRPGAFDPALWPIQRNWLTTFYMGAGPLALALVGLGTLRRKHWPWAAALLIGTAVLAFGFEPFFTWARGLVPGWRYLTHFSNAVFAALVFLSVMTARGAAALDVSRTRAAAIAAAFALAGAGLWLAPGVRGPAARALVDVEILTETQSAWMAAAGLTALLAAGTFGAAFFLPRRARAWALAAIALTDLWYFGRDLHPLAPSGFYHARAFLAQGAEGRTGLTPGAMRSAKPMAGETLVEGYAALRQHFYPNTHLPYRVYSAWGYEVFGHKTFAEFRRRIPNLPAASPPLDFLAVTRLVSLERLEAPNVFLAQSPIAYLYRRPGALERVSVVGAARVMAEPSARLDFLSARWDPRREVVLESGPASTGTPALDGWRDAPGRVYARGRGTGWLVHSGVDYPGWEGFINGAPAPIHRANHAFQALAVPGGEWRAALVYRPKAFRTGLAISLLALLGFLGSELRRRQPATRARRTK